MGKKKLEKTLDRIEMQLLHLEQRVDLVEKSISQLYQRTSDQERQSLESYANVFKIKHDLIEVRGAVELLKATRSDQ